MTGLPGNAFTTVDVAAATDERAWLDAMLDVERALARGAAAVGLASTSDAEAVVNACTPEAIDVAALEAGAERDATPVIELVRQLRAAVPEPVRRAVHLGATSQDVLDTAMVLVARRAVTTVSRDAEAAANLLCELAERHRDTVQVGRTLLQDGALTTFGAHLAARLVAVDEALDSLVAVAERRLCLQLGGPVGALPPVGGTACEYVSAVAAELGLPEPVAPWHTSRGRVAELASACAVLAGELGAVASDIVLLSQTSIGEVAVAEPGGSSAMPHKRNPSAAVLAIACAHRTPGLVATVLSGMRQELQRSAGTWQAEWDVVSELLRLVAATAAHTRRSLSGLRVDVDRMRQHAQSLDPAGDPGRAADVVDRAIRAHRARTSSRTEAERTP